MSQSPAPPPFGSSTDLSASSQRLLYGHDPVAELVAIELAGGDRVRLYRRDLDSGQTAVVEEAFHPWLVAARAEPWAGLRPQPGVSRLEGDHPLRYRVQFPTWSSLRDAVRAARDAKEPFFHLRSPVEQHLVASGRTLFQGMQFNDIRRLQLDIETTGFDPRHADTTIIIVALRCGEQIEEILHLESTEAALLQTLSERIRALDPDVIEGHNIFNFDLPFIVARAERHGVSLDWGRDGSLVRVGQGSGRFKAGALTLPFTPVYIAGRHVIDTFQQIQRYDTAGRLRSYGLKNAVEELGLTRADREFVPGDQIRDLWTSDRDRLLRYALDDVRDVDTLSQLATPTEFYQTQLVPRTYQAVATGGPGEKINDLMLRAYIMHNHSLPRAQDARDYPGGHAELLQQGVFKPVVKCDVESLYPSIMLVDGITAESDTLGAYLPMLAELTRRRLEAKTRSRPRTGGNEAERAMWEGMQGSFKVLINSFYGYLGYGGGLFNDYQAAERVTLAGQQLIKQVVHRLEATGSVPIEVDTDGVYFVPPPGVESAEAELTYVNEVAKALPPGIRLMHDGRFQSMISLKLKNYVLLDHDGAMLLKGSSLRSRRMEPCFCRFLLDAARAFLAGTPEDARDAYFTLAERLRRRDLDPTEFLQWAMINEDTLSKRPRLQRLVARSGTGPPIRSGDRIDLYEREDGELALVADYTNDENIPYLLRRLHDIAQRFASLFPSEHAFASFFPPISARTNVAAAREQPPSRQLSLL